VQISCSRKAGCLSVLTIRRLWEYAPPSALYRSLLASAKSFDLNLAADPNYSHLASREAERTFRIGPLCNAVRGPDVADSFIRLEVDDPALERDSDRVGAIGGAKFG
jgi:hypothetical protein